MKKSNKNFFSKLLIGLGIVMGMSILSGGNIYADGDEAALDYIYGGAI